MEKHAKLIQVYNAMVYLPSQCLTVQKKNGEKFIKS